MDFYRCEVWLVVALWQGEQPVDSRSTQDTAIRRVVELSHLSLTRKPESEWNTDNH